MIKLLIYIGLFSVGSYYLAANLPQSYKEKAAAAIGLGRIKGKTLEIFNPAARRAEILEKLEQNLTKVEEFQKSSANYRSPTSIGKTINIDGELESDVAPLLEESEKLIAELKELNPKTGILPKIVDKIIGADSPAPTNTFDLNQLTPDQKAEVCK